MKSIGDAVITTDAFAKIKYLNPVAEKLTGWEKADAKGKPIGEVLRIISETTCQPVENPVEEALRSGCSVGHAQEYILIASDNSEIAIDESAAPIYAKNGQIVGAVIVFQDVSHKRNMTRQLSWQATHDTLTRLLNRSEFERRLQEVLHSKKENQQHALYYLDLDQFTAIFR
ncbi:MAG: PAS domain-containing protein [Richelia sp. SM1_7_0]|nr:PAS domain-containing protein [Richelia sp. SM1_7_0]